MLDQGKSILAARNAFNALYNISQLLNTGLSKEELMICVRLCEKGVNPTMLANIIITMKNEMKNYNENAVKDVKQVMGQVHVTNPRYVLVVSGGCCTPERKSFVFGGWVCVCSCLTDVQRISLELMTLFPKCEEVETSLGVPLSVSTTAQVKIMSDKELLKIACEQFLGYDIEEIKYAISSTLEGHLRSILGTLTVEEVYSDREKFASLVREVAAPDVGRMGIEIISFTIKDITDKVGYLAALGKTQTAVVKRDASIGVAVANRDAGIREAEAEKEAMDFKYVSDANIAKDLNTYKTKLSEFEREIQTAQANVSLAYDMQASILAQQLKEAEVGIDITERKKQIEVEKFEVSRKELELTASVKLPADAEGYKMETIAEGIKNQKISEAQGEAEGIRLVGKAEAFKLEAIGRAEATQMAYRAQVFKMYSTAAKLSLIFNVLPKLAAEISTPLSRIDEMLLLGQSDDILDSVNKMMGKIPPALRTIAGIDVTRVLKARLASSQKGKMQDDTV